MSVVIAPWAAIIVGLFAGLLYLFTSKVLVRVRIDDAVEAIPVHMTNGIWGSFAVGLFAAPSELQLVYGKANHVGLFYSWHQGSGDGTLLGVQCLGILFVVGWVFCLMSPFFLFLNYKGWFRADVLNEIAGLDLSYHDGVDMELVTQIRNQRKNLHVNSRNRFSSNSACPHHTATHVDTSTDASLWSLMGGDIFTSSLRQRCSDYCG